MFINIYSNIIRFIAGIVIILVVSCNSQKVIGNYSIALDADTKDTVLPGSLMINGSLALMNNTDYLNILPDNGIFDPQKNYNFIFTDQKDLKSWGSASNLSRVDTIINSSFFVTAALDALQNQIPRNIKLTRSENKSGFANQYSSNQVSGAAPDILVELDSLTFHIQGEKQSHTSVSTSLTTQQGYPGTSTETTGNDFGEINIYYHSLWRISDLKSGNKKTISQSGVAKSQFTARYQIIDELVKCANKAGSDFSLLIRDN